MCRPLLLQDLLSDPFAAFPMFASAFLPVIVFQGIKARLEFMLGSRDEYAHFTVREYLQKIVEFIVEFGLGILFECVEIGGRDTGITKQKGYRSSREGITHLALVCHDFAVFYVTLNEFSVECFMVTIGHKIAVLVFRFSFSFLKHIFNFPCGSAFNYTLRFGQVGLINQAPFRRSRGNTQAKTLRRCCRLRALVILSPLLQATRLGNGRGTLKKPPSKNPLRGL